MAGRPTVMTKEVLDKLEFAFSCNCNNIEACLYADISTKTLDRYEEKNPEFSLRKTMLRSKPRMTAKIIQSAELEAKNSKTAEFILTHTDDEYKTKTHKEISGELTITPYEELIKNLSDDGEP